MYLEVVLYLEHFGIREVQARQASGQGGGRRKGYAFSLMLKIADFPWHSLVFTCRSVSCVLSVCVSSCMFVYKRNYQFLTNPIHSPLLCAQLT